MHTRFAVIALLLLPLAGCLFNTDSARVTTDYTAQVKKVGLVSLLGSRPNLSYLSTSAMESRFSDAVIDGWDADALVYTVMRPRLERKGFSVRILDASGALAAAKASDWRSPTADGKVAETVYALGESAGLDMVVVVQEQVSEDFVTDTNQKIRGYGLQRAFDTGPFLYADIYLAAYDIRRRFVVARATGQQHAAADEALWDARIERERGELRLDARRGAALGTALTGMLNTAIAIAAQEAGL